MSIKVSQSLDEPSLFLVKKHNAHIRICKFGEVSQMFYSVNQYVFHIFTTLQFQMYFFLADMFFHRCSPI